MDLNKWLTIIAYAAGTAAVAIPTLGLGVPAMLAPVLSAVATVAGKMAASHSDTINTQAALGAAAGAAAKAASDATRRG